MEELGKIIGVKFSGIITLKNGTILEINEKNCKITLESTTNG